MVRATMCMVEPLGRYSARYDMTERPIDDHPITKMCLAAVESLKGLRSGRRAAVGAAETRTVESSVAMTTKRSPAASTV